MNAFMRLGNPSSAAVMCKRGRMQKKKKGRAEEGYVSFPRSAIFSLRGHLQKLSHELIKARHSTRQKFTLFSSEMRSLRTFEGPKQSDKLANMVVNLLQSMTA